MDFFYKIINSGTEKVNDNFLIHKIRNTNFIAFLYSILAIVFVTFSYFYYFKLVLFPLSFILCGIIVILLNRAAQFQISRFTVCVLFNIIYTLYHAYITPANQEIIGSLYSIQIVFWIVPYLVYDFREYKFLIIYTISYIITGLYLPILKNKLEIDGLDITIITKGYLSFVIYGVSLSAITGVMLFIKWQMYLTENENDGLLKIINTKNTDLENQNEEIKLQQEEMVAHSDLMMENSTKLYSANQLIEGQNAELKYLNEQLEYEVRNRKKRTYKYLSGTHPIQPPVRRIRFFYCA